MKTTYLKEYINFSRKKVAYLPVGTIEWHGHHLPIETDFLIAQKICEILSKKKSGYVLPSIYLGTDRKSKVGNKKLIGMDSKLGKDLQGNLYYLKPDILFLMIEGLINNLIKQGFKKIYLVTGHAGSKQIEVLKKIEKKYKSVTLFDPFNDLSVEADHADEYETSLFWACYPEEEKKSRKIKIGNNDDFIKFQGYDARKKASLSIGKKMLNELIKKYSKVINFATSESPD